MLIDEYALPCRPSRLRTEPASYSGHVRHPRKTSWFPPPKSRSTTGAWPAPRSPSAIAADVPAAARPIEPPAIAHAPIPPTITARNARRMVGSLEGARYYARAREYPHPGGRVTGNWSSAADSNIQWASWYRPRPTITASRWISGRGGLEQNNGT